MLSTYNNQWLSADPPLPPMPASARKVELWWLCGLILSFAHERPILVLTSMDRINPRLFDVMVVIGILFVLPKLRRAVRLPREFYYWALIVTIFVFCALIYAIALLPFQYGAYSLFFAAKYLEGLIVIYMALKIPLSQEQKVKVIWTIAIGGVYVATFSIYQYFTTTVGGTIEIAPGKFVRYFSKILTGPLSYSYFHLAQFSSLCAIVTLSLVETVRGTAKRWGVVVLAGFVSWPLFFSGSRTGLALLAFSTAFGFLLLRGAKSYFLGLLLVIGVVLIVAPISTNMEMLNESATFSRLSGSEGSHNSIENRLTSVFRLNLDNYKWSTLMPLIGGGFYVAPTIEGSYERYRVGYGFHNTYLFAFEQGGILAAIVFLYFLYAIIRKLNRVRKVGAAADRAFAIAALSYMLASLPIYLAGQIFWMGFESGHFNAFLLIVLLIASRPTVVTAGASARQMHDSAYRPVVSVAASATTTLRPIRNI